MPRIKKVIEKLGYCVVLERVTETYTHRCGDTLRGDPANRLWYDNGCSWYGVPPKGWDDALAVEEVWTRTFEVEADYS